MEKNIDKYKILVLSDLKNSASNIIKSTVSLAKMINADVELFHVKDPIKVIEKENQLSANRIINQQYNITQKKIQNLINPICKDYGVTINYTYSFGNVKNEIGKYIIENTPDVIVLGKRKSKALGFIGNNIMDFVLKEFLGVIVIVDNQNSLEPNKELSLGIFNGINSSINTRIIEDLIDHSQKPIKSFKILKNSNTLMEIDIPQDKKTIEYVFEYNDNTIKNLSNYLSKNNINLLCIDRGEKNDVNKKNLIKSDIDDVIKNLNVSILITGGQDRKFQ
tara:strand:- start:1653 stop:2486 length:834 start_codon:yes stop_codon:yes gene_type:complete